MINYATNSMMKLRWLERRRGANQHTKGTAYQTLQTWIAWKSKWEDVPIEMK